MQLASGVLGKVRGWVEWTLRNADGSVAGRGRQDNVMTNMEHRMLVTNRTMVAALGAIWILDDERPANLKRDVSIFRRDSQTPNAQNDSPTVTYNAGTFTISRTVSFASPSSPTRTVRKIGLSFINDAFGANSATAAYVGAYLSLSPAIVQSTGQTLELVYRQQFVIPSKGLNRWEQITLPNLRRIAHLWGGGVSGQSFDNQSMEGGFRVGGGIAYGKSYFTDMELRQAALSDLGTGSWRIQGSADNTSNAFQAARVYATSFTVATGSNSAKIGAAAAAHVEFPATWGGASDTDNGGVVNSNMRLSLGVQPLSTAEGDISTVFKHPAGEGYFFNVTGSVADSQGAVEVQGPYRPDDEELPVSHAYEVHITDSGGTNGGTEAKYTVTRGQFAENQSMTGDASSQGMPHRKMWRGVDNDTTVPGSATLKTTAVHDGKGLTWVAGARDSTKSSLHFWKALTLDEISPDQLVTDTTRFFGLEQSVPFECAKRYGVSIYAVPTLATDGVGRTFFGKRGTAGNQAVFVLDNTKPGRYYQRPSGVAAGGNQTFTVNAADKIHGMFPFVGGDVGKSLRIEETPGVYSVRTITAFNNANSVDLSGGALPALSNVSWHWVVVTKRGSGTGLASQPRALAYDKVNSRLWAFQDTGIQVSTDLGATWSALITDANGLSTPDAIVIRGQGGSGYGQTTVAVGNSGELYWVDTLGGVNKYVGSGPGGTHSRITTFGGSFPSYGNGFQSPWTGAGIWGLCFDPVAPHRAAGDGALWMVPANDDQARSFYRIDLDLAFTSGNVVSYLNPTPSGLPANQFGGGIHAIVATPGGRVCFASHTSNLYWAYWDPATDTFGYFHLFQPTPAAQDEGGWGTQVVTDDGHVIQFAVPRQDQRSWKVPTKLLWNDITQAWIPWWGSGAQFDARYGTTNNGKRLAHTAWKPIKDNVHVRFIQDGSVAQAQEYVASERFTFVGTMGVARTNVQDLSWQLNHSMVGTEMILENETVRTVAGRGALQAFWKQDATAVATVAGQALGPAGIPALDSGGHNYGWAPRRTYGLYNNPTFGPVPNTLVASSGHKYMAAGLDLGSSLLVSKMRVQLYLLRTTLRRFKGPNTDEQGRFRLYWSDDNVSWTAVPEVSAVMGEAGVSEPSAGYAYCHMESNSGGMGPQNPHTSSWTHVTFDLEGAGLSSGARTHRYWKFIVTCEAAEAGANSFGSNEFIFGSMAAFNSADEALVVNADLRLPEASDPNLLYTGILEASLLQDKVGDAGKGGINSAPHALADGYTDTVTIASGVFDTADINITTDFLAYRHPSTGKFLRPEGSTGHPGALGEQTAVRILSVTSSTIVVAKRNIPDNLSGVDWEVRRPLTPTATFPTAGQIGFCPVAGYLQFHPDDNGKLFKITRRSVVRRA